MSAWIHMVPLEEATGSVKDAYELAKTPSGTVDNVMRAHSLRPHTMVGHLKLYRSVLHLDDAEAFRFSSCTSSADCKRYARGA